MPTDDGSMLRGAFGTITANAIATPLHDPRGPLDEDGDFTDPFGFCGSLPKSPANAARAEIVDWKSLQVARLNHQIAVATGNGLAAPPDEQDFQMPYVGVLGDTPLPVLFGEPLDGPHEVPRLPVDGEAPFWVVTAGENRLQGTLTADNLLRLPGRLYLFMLILRGEQLAAEYCYRLPHLFSRLRENRQRQAVVQSLNFDSRWQQLADADDETLMDPGLRRIASLAPASRGDHPQLLTASDPLVAELLQRLRANQVPEGGRMALRLILESTTLRDRKNMLAHANDLQPQQDLIHRVFGHANRIRDRIAHPFPAMSTSHDDFWDFTDLPPMANEPLDEGLDRPLYESWPHLLDLPTLHDIRAFTSELLIVTDLLETVG
ncbi:MAG: hypothetical protein FJ286_10535 [Planctomycetes bacterium]|nr:hypothetical protein [Planctomycetota bacterium]